MSDEERYWGPPQRAGARAVGALAGAAVLLAFLPFALPLTVVSLWDDWRADRKLARLLRRAGGG